MATIFYILHITITIIILSNCLASCARYGIDHIQNSIAAISFFTGCVTVALFIIWLVSTL